jgi:hypothetical protein
MRSTRQGREYSNKGSPRFRNHWIYYYTATPRDLKLIYTWQTKMPLQLRTNHVLALDCVERQALSSSPYLFVNNRLGIWGANNMSFEMHNESCRPRTLITREPSSIKKMCFSASSWANSLKVQKLCRLFVYSDMYLSPLAEQFSRTATRCWLMD